MAALRIAPGGCGETRASSTAASEIASLQKTLGPGDRSRVSEYVDAVRELERRIQRSEEQSAKIAVPLPDRPAGIPENYEEHLQMMFDLQTLAWQGDITRVISFMMGRELSQRVYPAIGVTDAHHGLTHHQGNQEKIAKVIKINTYHMKMFARFLDKLKKTPDGEGSLLDHSMILYGGGISDGNLHNHSPLPSLLAGGGSGQLTGGRHLRYPDHTPMSNQGWRCLITRRADRSVRDSTATETGTAVRAVRRAGVE
jgi:hypothetical protein